MYIQKINIKNGNCNIFWAGLYFDEIVLKQHKGE